MLKIKDNHCYFTNRFGDRYSMPFNLYQGINGGIYLGIGVGAILLSKEQLLSLDLPIIEVNDYDHNKFREFYKLVEKSDGNE